MTDVNVLVYAHREELPQHSKHKSWLEELIAGDEPYGMADTVLSSFVRIVTHHRIFSPPSTVKQALDFATAVRQQPNCVSIVPGDRHWHLFARLCEEGDIKGALVADAYIAALAMEHGCELATSDGDFARFAPALRIQKP